VVVVFGGVEFLEENEKEGDGDNGEGDVGA